MKASGSFPPPDERRDVEIEKVETEEQNEWPPFDINLPVILVGFAFEAYPCKLLYFQTLLSFWFLYCYYFCVFIEKWNPNLYQENVGRYEVDAVGCKTVFLSECRKRRHPYLRPDATTSISKRQKLVNCFNDLSKVGSPMEEDLKSWGHHFYSMSVPDTILQASMGDESCILEFDGVSKENPEQAGAETVLRAEDGSVVAMPDFIALQASNSRY
ncbi:hypothetical protein Ddye_012527 [Dipteronia dyeriana]|uniref:Uncharacterized protein n=1 Tax=Dipteronia dyeriana TaxID=168575 RepID=A0AAD9X4R2_9ROSI|nr:hypothetical protein Ddye_012527 [Dipteronia dyeriana]